jgi:lipopolysaccharide transport system permease protein
MRDVFLSEKEKETGGPVTGRTSRPEGEAALVAGGAGQPTPLLKIRPATSWAAINFRELWQFRDLAMTLAGRDLKLRYKQTALGVVWVLLQPLLAAGVFTFVFGKVAKMPSDGMPYFLFSYAGLLGWNLFFNTVTKSSGCLVGNAHLISKVFFPRLVLPLSTVPSTLVDFAVAAGMMAVLMVIYHVAPGPGLLLLPVWIVLLLLFSLGIGLVTAGLAVSYRDVTYILPVLMQLVMYASPIAYAATAVPERLRKWYDLNPLAPLLEAFRWSLLRRGELSARYLSLATIVSVLLFVVGLYSFKRMERKFADVI